MAPPPTPNPAPPPLRILMLHGFTQSPPLFHAKTRALAKSLARPFPNLHLRYVPAPHRLAGADIPGHDPAVPVAEAPEAYGWWRRKDHVMKDGQGKEAETGVVYEGIERGLQSVADCIREEGPFDGVVGFSQGAAAAAMVASLLEGRTRKEAFAEAEARGGMPYPASFLGEVDGFVQAPLKFAVCYSGFRAPGKLYEAFYEPRIRTKVLNVLGQVDVVVDEVRGMQLVSVCEGGEGMVVVHPGGHFVPSQKPWLDAVVGFVKQRMEGEGEGKKEDKEEERVEDMDVPF
ncbi:hypothetical protein HO133_001037 [Letharia lupina]|uniref:Serine hydrolase domain-containing protein n=1 Tax=Letharia lupina TaxID=560253 RepID=A0A8H6CGT6_9LECA|nr:uncharacterized protein HO133_001037 [Letharia lupina]KAF6222986.1 hypothetical protein HO133_001037 [Letharia lupina]